MRYSRDAHKPRGVVDQVDDPPVAYSNAPLILVSLQFLAANGPGVISEGFQFSHRVRQQIIRQVFEFFPRRRLDLNEIATHAAFRAGLGLA